MFIFLKRKGDSMQSFNDFSKSAGSYKTLPLIESFYTDVLTPIHMFNALKDDALYILESQDPASEWSNYSFIGLDPFIDISEAENGFLMTDFDTDKTLPSPLCRKRLIILEIMSMHILTVLTFLLKAGLSATSITRPCRISPASSRATAAVTVIINSFSHGR